MSDDSNFYAHYSKKSRPFRMPAAPADPRTGTRIPLQNDEEEYFGEEAFVQSDQGDYLVCRTKGKDDELGLNDIYVLKPDSLRRTEYDGTGVTKTGSEYTYASNYERTDDTESEDYEITPSYWDQATILVMSQNNLVHVTGTDGVENDIRLVDMNVDARSWALV